MMGVRTVLVDSQVLFVEGLSRVIGAEVPTIKLVGTAKTAAELHEITKELDVDLILMDLNLDDEESATIIKNLKKNVENLRILVISAYSDWRYVKDSFLAGADGFLDKRCEIDELKEGIEQVLLGYRFLGKGLSITPSRVSGSEKSKVSKYHDKFTLKQSLTKRETEILGLITQAKSNKEIGEELFISDQTVGVHRRNIMRKLGVKNTVNLVKVAYEHQLVQ